MSQEFALPSVDEATGTLDQVYARVFFNKLASLGHVAQTEDDARAMLETGAALDSIPEPVTKQGAAGSYANANNLLQTKMAEAGLLTPQQSQAAAQNDTATKQASLAFAQYPEVYKAVLAVKSAEAAA